MRSAGSGWWTALLVVALLATITLLWIPSLMRPVHEAGEGVARDRNIGRAGIVLVGIAGPVVGGIVFARRRTRGG